MRCLIDLSLQLNEYLNNRAYCKSDLKSRICICSGVVDARLLISILSRNELKNKIELSMLSVDDHIISPNNFMHFLIF